MPAKRAFGTILQIPILSVDTTIANVTNINGVDASCDIIDGSSHDSADEYREKLNGFKDAGDVKLELNYDPANTTHQAVEDALATSKVYKLKYSNAPVGRVTGTFTGFMKAFSTGSPHDGKHTASVTIAVTGKITWA